MEEAAGMMPAASICSDEVDNFIFIAPSQNTIYLHDVLHVTVSATGQMTSAFTDVTFTCRR